MTSPNPYQKVAAGFDLRNRGRRFPSKKAHARIVPRLRWYRGWFVFTCSKADGQLARQAGLRWYAGTKAWATKDWEIAYRLKDYADDSCQLILGPQFDKARARLLASRATDAQIEIPAPEGLAYLPFQRAGVDFARDLDGVLIGDEMGLGKTIQAIVLINIDPSTEKVLVICPASLKLNWERELRKWLTRPMSVGVVTQSAYFPLGFNVTIVNYDILHRHAKAIRSVEWDLLIADEAHYLKSKTARRSRYVYGDDVKGIAPIRARKRVFLTGTPIANRPVELWPLVHYLAPDVFKDEDDYMRKYRFANPSRQDGRQALGSLQGKLRMSCLVRRLKKDVLTDLPPKMRAVIELPPGAAGAAIREEQLAMEELVGGLLELRVRVELLKASDDEEAYKAAVKELKAQGDELFGQISTLRHKTALAKVPLVVEHVGNAVSDEHPVVLFAHHKDVIKAYHEAFPGSVVLTGGMGLAERQKSIDDFQEGKSNLFIGSLYAAGVGITLTKSSHVVFAELDWVPGTMTQAEDRCHRIGQVDSVQVQHLVLEGSLDALMAEKLVQKQAVIEAALDAQSAEEIAADPIVPELENPATQGMSRAEVARQAERITIEVRYAVQTAVNELYASKGRMHSVDEAMLSDLFLGVASELKPKEVVLARRIARKYKDRLSEPVKEAIG